MRVIRATALGMCFGVRDALAAMEQIADPAGVTVHGELVHNEEVIRRLDERGFAMNPEAGRTSLPLTERDLADLERLRGQTPERDALAELVGMEVQSVTEAALLHMIFAAGLRAIRERAEEHAYASAAADRLASGESAESRLIARRRRPAWANED